MRGKGGMDAKARNQETRKTEGYFETMKRVMIQKFLSS